MTCHDTSPIIELDLPQAYQTSLVKLPLLIEQLTRSDLYPHSVEVITTIETHISVVFLTGNFAYKLKKPVDFGFLDFTQLKDRKRFCELEVSLNSRSAPTLYLGICPLYFKNNQLQFEAYGEPVEYVIKMAQFNPNLVLGRHLQDDTLTEVQTQSLAKSIAQFHLTAESAAADSTFGDPEDLIHPMLENFPSLLDTFDHPEIQYRLRQLADWTIFTQKQLYARLAQRKTEGFVRACHGDMHLDNITLLNDTPTLFDGIEFNEQFRWIDVMNDMAFLMIDLDHRQQFALKHQLLSQYLSITGDYEGLIYLRFYQVYRNMVRAKITALRYHQLPKQSHQALECHKTAIEYLTQAENDAYDLSEPKLILMQGVSGSGKSFYAHQILKHYQAVVISSDIERKRLYGIPPLARVSENEIAQLYSPEMNAKTYARLLMLAEVILAAGFSVIVDATFLKRDSRTPFSELAEKHHCPYQVFYIESKASHLQQIEANLDERLTLNNNPSDADHAVMQRQLKMLEVPDIEEQPFQVTPNSELNIESLKIWLYQSI